MRHELFVKYNDRTRRLIIADAPNDRFKVLAGDEAEASWQTIQGHLEDQVNEDPATGRDFSNSMPGIEKETPAERNQSATIL